MMKNKNKFVKFKVHKGFTGLPNKILALNLSPMAGWVFFYYVSCTEEYNPSVRRTAELLNISPSTIVKINKELEKARLIVKIEQGGVVVENGKRVKGGSVTKYALCHPQEWKQLNGRAKVKLY